MEMEARQKTIAAIIQVLADNGCNANEAKILLKDTERIIGESAFKMTWRAWWDNPIMDFMRNHEILTTIVTTVVASICASLLVLALSL